MCPRQKLDVPPLPPTDSSDGVQQSKACDALDPQRHVPIPFCALAHELGMTYSAIRLDVDRLGGSRQSHHGVS
jgi:hypothetical protein